MQQPIPGEPVHPDALKKGDLIFIQRHGEEPELGIFLLNSKGRVLFHSFSEPDNRVYDYYITDGWMPAFFRANPATFVNSQIEEFRKSDLFKYLGEPVNSIPYMRQRIGDTFYFEENKSDSLYDFVAGTLVQFSMTPSGNYRLIYEGQGRQRHVRRGEVGEKPEIYEYDGPRRRAGPPGNLLGPGGRAVRNATIAALGPEAGVQRIIEAVPGAAITRRGPLTIAYNKALRKARREWEAKRMARENFDAPNTAPGGGAANNNTTKGGSRQKTSKAHFLTKRRRKTRRGKK